MHDKYPCLSGHQPAFLFFPHQRQFCRILHRLGRILICGLCVCASGWLPGQVAVEPATDRIQKELKQYSFEYLEIEAPGRWQGAPNTALQTRDGYLWLGTNGGLAKFDGVHFTFFRPPDAPAFLNQTIHCLYEDDTGNLWIGAHRGLFRYRKGNFEQIGLPDTAISALAQDHKGRMWIGTYGKGLYSWQDGQFQSYNSNPVIPDPVVDCLFVDSSDRVWVGFKNTNGVMCGENGVFRSYNAGGKLPGEVQAICEQPRGTLWFGTLSNRIFRLRDNSIYQCTDRDGLVTSPIFDLKPSSDGGVWVVKGVLQKIVDTDQCIFATIPGVPSETIRTIFEDRERNVWLCCFMDGLIRGCETPYQSISMKDGLPGNGVKTVTEDSQGNLWMAIQRQGVVKMAPDGRITTYTKNEGLLGLDPALAYPASDGSVWIASGPCLCVYREGAFKSYPGIPFLRGAYEDHEGAMWLGTKNDGVFRYKDGKFSKVESAPGQPIPYATSFFETSDGTMYVGTWQAGLFKIKGDPKSDCIAIEANGLPTDDVRAVYVDKEGHIWVGLKDKGLAAWQDGRWTYTTALSQALANQVTAIAEDDRHQLWLGTFDGVMWAPKDELLAAARGERSVPKLKNIEMVDGSHVASVWSGSQPVMWQRPDHSLLFATRFGLLAIDPDHLSTNTVPPPVDIENVTLDGRAVETRGGIRIPAGIQAVVIEYAALSFSRTNLVRFKYMLEGYDRNWVDAGTRRIAYYGRLPAGNYVFKVKACNSDGVWNEQGVQIALTQQPHFYERRWFYGIVLRGAAGAVWGFSRWSNHQLQSKLDRLEQKQAVERDKEKERLRIARNLHDGLGANLTEIGLFAEAARHRATSPETTRDMTFLSERVRGMTEALDAVVWVVNPVTNDSLDHLSAYICETFEALLRLSSIRGRQDVKGAIPACPVTPEERSNLFLTAKEAINNLVKHSGATEAWLRIKMDGDRFCLSLEDNGVGFDPSSPENARRNGLANMRSRIAELKGTLILDSMPGKGTSILISVSFAHRNKDSAIERS